MAVVYSALDTTCDRKVALKILRPSIAARRPLSADLLKREAATAVRLHARTPHVVEVLTAGVTDDAHRLPYYVMERLHGTTLRTAIDDRRALGRPFELLELIDLGAEIAAPLAVAHEMGIVHRDIKPQNVFLAEQRDHATLVKLLDFGLSALTDDAPRAPSAPDVRTFTGSRRYASPEQLDGRRPTPESDVYSLALILYEMLTLTLPHHRLDATLSPTQLALNVLHMPVPPPRALRPDTLLQLENLLLNCLENGPEMRMPAEVVARKLGSARETFKREVLGIDDNATDVSGLPAEVFAQRLDTATGTVPERVDATVPLAAPAPVAGEVFFMGPAVEATVPIPQQIVASPETTARLPAQPPAPLPNVVIPPWSSPPPPPALPRRRVSRGPLWFAFVTGLFALCVAAFALTRCNGHLSARLPAPHAP
jgi:serine/threonine-protein kinase